VYYIWISDGCNHAILNRHSLLAGNLIPSCQPKNYLIMLPWFIPDEMMCCQYQTTMASRDMKSYIRDKLIAINRYIGALATKWTCTNQTYFDHTILVWANKPWDTYVLGGAGYSPFNIWPNTTVAAHCIFGCNKE